MTRGIAPFMTYKTDNGCEGWGGGNLEPGSGGGGCDGWPVILMPGSQDVEPFDPDWPVPKEGHGGG